MLAQSQVLMLPLDVVNTREDTNVDMRMFWYIIQMTSLFYMTVILPFCLFYAETDEEKDFKWRLSSAFKNLVLTLGTVSVILFPLYTYTSYAEIPIQVNTCSTTQTNASPSFVPADYFVDFNSEINPSVCITGE